MVTCLPVSAQIATAIWKPGTGPAVLLTHGQEPTVLDSVISTSKDGSVITHLNFSGLLLAPGSGALSAPAGYATDDSLEAGSQGGESAGAELQVQFDVQHAVQLQAGYPPG